MPSKRCGFSLAILVSIGSPSILFLHQRAVKRAADIFSPDKKAEVSNAFFFGGGCWFFRCVCVSKSVSKTHDQQIVLAVWQRWVHKVETIIFLYNGMLESRKEMDTLMYEEIMTHENTNMGG